MLKMTIDNEEVLSNNDISIKEEILSPSSTILNNVYPKSWELDKDYTSRFYYPKDYSKLNIQNFSVEPEEAGKTIQVNGSATLTDVDTSKESRVLRLLGQTSQTGTPTPDIPIPVNVVSGDNTIDICGKNLFQMPTTETKNGLTFILNSDGTFNATGTPSAYTALTLFVPVGESNLVDGKYYYQAHNIGNVIRAVQQYTSNKGYISNINISGGGTYTKDSNCAYIGFVLGFSSGTQYNITNGKMMLVEGKTAPSINDWEPYIGKSYPIYLGVENLFNISTNTDGKVLASNGAITNDVKFTISDYIKVLPNTNYTISWVYDSSQSSDTAMRVGYYQSDKTFISRPYNTTSPYTITTPNNCYYIRLCYEISSHTQIQVELGDKANSFTPYGANYIELCKIGTYQDYIYKDNGSWYLHKEIGKVVLNGSENWVKHGSIASWFYYDGIINGYVLDNTQILIKTNYYTPKAYQGVPNLVNGECAFGSSDSGVTHRFVIKNTDYTQTNDFKNWLSTHNTIVYYVLATPTNTEITDTLLLEQLESLSS